MNEVKQKSITIAISHLNTLPPAEIANDEKVRAMFIRNYNAIHRSELGDQVYELEKYYFARIVSSSKELSKCTKPSLYACFIEMGVMKLSFDSRKKLCYLVPQNVNIGTKENEVWEKRAVLEISPYGELAIRQDMGQILSVDNPEVVYENEAFEITQSSGKQVYHKFGYPREGKIIACYMRIIKSDGTNDYFIMDLAGMQRLKAYSAKKNKGAANALYGAEGGEPDTGFWIAKTIKHGFKAYPPVKLKGSHTKLQEDVEDEEIDYGMDETDHEVVSNGNGHVTETFEVAEQSNVKEEIDF